MGDQMRKTRKWRHSLLAVLLVLAIVCLTAAGGLVLGIVNRSLSGFRAYVEESEKTETAGAADMLAADIATLQMILYQYLSDSELLAAAEEKYHVFHISIDKGMPGDDRISAEWNALMPGRAAVIGKKNIACLAELIFALISLAEGKTQNEALRAVDQSAAEIIADALAPIRMADQNIISF